MTHDARSAIEASVARLRRRSFFVNFVRAEIRWLFYSLLAAAAVALVLKLLPFLGFHISENVTNIASLVNLGIAGCAAGTAGALAAAWFRKTAPLAAAKAWDDGTGGKDRLASAYQLRDVTTPMGNALIAEAVEVSKRVAPARVFPLRMPREGWLMPLPFAVAMVISLLPGWLGAAPAISPEVTEAIRQQAANVKNFVAKERAKDPTQQRKEMLERLERLASDLSRDKMRKKDALAELAKLMEQLRKDKEQQEQKKLDLEKLLKNFQANDKTRELSNEINNGKYDDAANRIEKLMDKLKDQIDKKKKDGAKEDELKDLDDQLRKLQDVKAQLLKMLQVKLNIKKASEVMEFLGDIEGELGELPDEEIIDGKP